MEASAGHPAYLSRWMGEADIAGEVTGAVPPTERLELAQSLDEVRRALGDGHLHVIVPRLRLLTA